MVDTTDRVKARFVVGFMGFLGLALVYAMRVNLSVAIVAMVNNTQPEVVNVSDVCSFDPPPGPEPEPTPVCNFSSDCVMNIELKVILNHKHCCS